MPAKKEISLLPEEENTNSVKARAIRWLATFCRFSLVFTELIVIGAFLARLFWLDRKNNDLKEIIRQQTAILESVSEFEEEYGALQNRFKIIRQVYADKPQYDQQIQQLVQITPPDIIYDSIRLNSSEKDGDVYDLSLATANEDAIVEYVANLVLHPDITRVNLQTIEKKPKDTKYIINLSLNFSSSTDDGGS